MAWLHASATTTPGDDHGPLEARARGQIRSLEQLLVQVERQIPGRLLKAELDHDEGIPIYELRWQMPDGRRLEIAIDARDGRWLTLEGPRLETVFKPTGRHDHSATKERR